METVVNSLLGVAVVVALAGFLASIVQVSDAAPRIARSLERQPGAPATMVAGVPTNAPAPGEVEPMRTPSGGGVTSAEGSSIGRGISG